MDFIKDCMGWDVGAFGAETVTGGTGIAGNELSQYHRLTCLGKTRLDDLINRV